MHNNSITTALERAADRLSIVSFNKAQAIKDTAKHLTGTLLTMTLIVPDNFDYCTPGLEFI